MSVWGDIRRRADGTSVRKEEDILAKIKLQEDAIKKMNDWKSMFANVKVFDPSKGIILMNP